MPAFGLKVPKGSRTHRELYDLGNGSQLIPKSLDDMQRGQSAEADGAYLCEVSELEKNDAMAMTASVRPRAGVSIDYQQIIMDINPVAPGFWFNKLCEPAGDDLRLCDTPENYAKTLAFNRSPAPDGYVKRIITSMADNPGYFDVLKWGETENGQSYLEGMKWLDGFMASRWLRGLWVAAEGSVFGASFLASRNVTPRFNVPKSWPIWIRIDPGVDHPCGVSWITIGPAGTVIVVYAISVRGMFAADIAQKIHAVNAERGWVPFAVYLDPRHGWATTFQSQKTISDQFEEFGLHCLPWVALKMSGKDAAVEETARAMREGRLAFVDGDAEAAVGEVQSWQYKRNASGEQREGDDQYEDKSNDVLDGLMSFMVEGHTFEEGQPVVEARREFVPGEEL
jgi:hypothetical protein